jgi:hypothetical protein
MSDYIVGLRQDLVEAAARQQQRSPTRRAARPLHPRSWSPLAVLGAGAAVAGLLLLVVTLRAVSPPAPPTAPKLVRTYQLGGQPRDAAVAGDALAIADFGGTVIEVSPSDPGDRRELEVGGTPNSIAVDGTSVWVTSGASLKDLNRSYLVQLDARTGRRLARVPLQDRYASHLAVGAGGVWMAADLHAGGLARFDPLTHRQTAYVPRVEVEGVAATDRALWTRAGETVTQWDAAGRVIHRVDGVSPSLGDESQRTLLADADGAWVVGQSDGRLYRVVGGHVVNRVEVGETAGAIAGRGSTVWVGASPDSDRWELVRVDAREGEVTGRVDIGRFAPQAIVPLGDDVWVVTKSGALLQVSQGR